MKDRDGRYDEQFEMRVRRTHVVFELEDGATIKAEIAGGEGLVRIIDPEPDLMVFGEPQPIRTSFHERLLRVEAEGRFESVVIDGLKPRVQYVPGT